MSKDADTADVNFNSGLVRRQVPWADLLIDVRANQVLQYLPEALPAPGFSHSFASWRQGTVTADLPDTSHLPGGGPGGQLTLSAHQCPNPKDPYALKPLMVLRATYPDGFRLGWTFQGSTNTHGDPQKVFSEWLSSPTQGLSYAFMNLGDTRRHTPIDGPTPSVPTERCRPLAARAYGLRHLVTSQFDDFVDRQDGFGLERDIWAASHGLTCYDDAVAVQRNGELHRLAGALQGSGFWLADPTQVNWLSTGGFDFAKSATLAGGEAPTVLYRLYQGGWHPQAFDRIDERYLQGLLEVGWEQVEAAVTGWERTVQRALAVQAIDEKVAVQSIATEAASLCLILGLDEFEVGLMAGERTFSVEGLRTLCALTQQPTT